MFGLVLSLLGTCALLLFCPCADGYGIGPPLSTCLTRYPKHSGLMAQSSPCPYVITLSPQTYKPGDVITVNVSGPSGKTFKGIQMGAFRDTGHTEEMVGRFVDYRTDKLKTFSCFPGFQNMITHASGGQVYSLVFNWTAPSQNVGNLTFTATVVADYQTFWWNVQAHLRSSDSAMIAPSLYQEVVHSPMVQAIDFCSCGKNKGCFLYPRHCSGDDCVAAVSYQYQPATDDYLFEMSSTAAKNYLSVGFSSDRKMTHEETISCVSNAGIMDVQHGWNPGYYNEKLLTRFISGAEIRHEDGRMQCRFVLPRTTSVYMINQTAPSLMYANKTYDHDTEWYIQLAWGKTMRASDVMTLHDEMPAVTVDKVSLKKNEIHRGSSFPILVQVHGALMMIGWIFLGGIVTVVSRHYRDWMPRTRWCGTKVWFQIHRALAILIVILTGIGLAVVFAHYGADIRESAVPHAYVGLAVTAAVGVQTIAGLLRPGPESKIRVIFNWCHRFLGQAAHILAAVTMFLAYDIKYFTEDMKIFGFTTLAVWVAVQIIWHIVFEVLSCRGKPLSTTDPKKDSEQGKPRDVSCLQTGLMIVYLIFLAGLCIACLLSFLFF